ncbi:MAG: sulfotransferase [Planctomycetes bacterium]|nr:sulfotransferase [Planctomycetota bacterium]
MDSREKDVLMRDSLVFIGGSGRSGSTLLELLLNQNSLIRSVGEFFRLSQYARTNLEPCTCGRPVMECPFWLEVQAELQRTTGEHSDPQLLKSFEVSLPKHELGMVTNLVQRASLVLGNPWLHRSISRRFLRRTYQTVQNSMVIYEVIRRVTHCPVILESTKVPRRLKELYLADPRSFKLIYLIRDGRAVAASAMRRIGMDMKTAAGEWERWNRRSWWAQLTVPARQKIRIRYEDICQSTEPTLQSICQFLEIPFEQSMLELRKSESHSLGGNPMRFRQEESTIRLDEQWREQLTEKDLSIFNSVAGRMNRRFGYTS